MWDKILEFLISDAGSTIIIYVLGLGFAALLKLSFIKKYKLEKGIQAIEAGVYETYLELVKHFKEANEGKSLTEEQRQSAMKSALSKAQEIGLKQGVNIAKLFGKEYLPVLVNKIVAKIKPKK